MQGNRLTGLQDSKTIIPSYKHNNRAWVKQREKIHGKNCPSASPIWWINTGPNYSEAGDFSYLPGYSKNVHV